MIAKPRTGLWIGIVATAMICLAMLAADQAYIDSCLDFGGSIDYDAFRCDLDKSHPAQSYLTARAGRYMLVLSGGIGWILLSVLAGRRPAAGQRDADTPNHDGHP